MSLNPSWTAAGGKAPRRLEIAAGARTWRASRLAQTVSPLRGANAVQKPH